jgi:biotin carboxyl carrier protein
MAAGELRLMEWTLTTGTTEASVTLLEEGDSARLTVRLGTDEWQGTGDVDSTGEGKLRTNNRGDLFYAVRTAEGVEVWLDGEVYRIRAAGRGGAPASAGTDIVAAPMPGMVVRVMVADGDAVSEGDGILVLESMKMQLTLTAPCAGKVRDLKAKRGVMVEQGAILARIDPETSI